MFPLGPANAADGVTGKTVTLPAGQFSTLSMIGSAGYGPHTGTVVVTYTDGSTSIQPELQRLGSLSANPAEFDRGNCRRYGLPGIVFRRVASRSLVRFWV